MTSERRVCIVGDIAWGAEAGDHKFHRGECYVLDQIGNRDFNHQALLSDLPDSFKPCLICTPAGRHETREIDPSTRLEGIEHRAGRSALVAGRL